MHGRTARRAFWRWFPIARVGRVNVEHVTRARPLLARHFLSLFCFGWTNTCDETGLVESLLVVVLFNTGHGRGVGKVNNPAWLGIKPSFPFSLSFQLYNQTTPRSFLLLCGSREKMDRIRCMWWMKKKGRLSVSAEEKTSKIIRQGSDRCNLKLFIMWRLLTIFDVVDEMSKKLITEHTHVGHWKRERKEECII